MAASAGMIRGVHGLTDAIADKAVEYVESFSKSERPFFLYMAHCAPHWPLHARPEDIAKYKDVYKDGWHKLRRDRYRAGHAAHAGGDDLL